MLARLVPPLLSVVLSVVLLFGGPLYAQSPDSLAAQSDPFDDAAWIALKGR